MDEGLFSYRKLVVYQHSRRYVKTLYLLMKKFPAEEKIGGIIIPDTAKEKPLQGTVAAVGNGTKDEEMILKVGDNVLYGKYAGQEIEYKGEKFIVMRQSDVIAILG